MVTILTNIDFALGKPTVLIIPLDYYRILGVPIQATEEQISQAYRDRSLQISREEYSDYAINARQKLLEKAYQVLCDPQQRTQYDRQFFPKTSPIEANLTPQLPEAEATSNNNTTNPSLEVPQDQLVGAVIILQELGEYELVLRLGKALLKENQYSAIAPETNNYQITADIVLTIVLAYLELGREQWLQGEYEKAADSLNKGRDLLLTQQLFPSVQNELKGDVYKLRPYCILELLAKSTTQVQEREKGLQLLQEMLQERQGIDGKGEDKSGLDLDNFLQFIQQIQTFLTVAEQQEIFELEAKRPSPVAIYLAFYALLARGFVEKKPALIVQAKRLIRKLSKSQDVYLEKAICALLLGQTEEAMQSLENSQENEILEFIRQQSQTSPDLLPGLCLYVERWLETDAFSHFRDLINKRASLKEYFANEQVQTYLEELSLQEQQKEISLESSRQLAYDNPATSLEKDLVSTNTPETNTLSTSMREPQSRSTRKYRSRISSRSYSPNTRKRRRKNTVTSSEKGEVIYAQRIINRRRKRKLSRTTKKVLFFGFIAMIGLGFFIIIANLFSGAKQVESTHPNVAEPLEIGINQPPVAIPKTVFIPNQPLNIQTATQVIEKWLSIKSQAFGKDYRIDLLNTILVEPMLSKWRSIAQSFEKNGSYRTYEHEITVESVDINEENLNQATIIAKVREISKYYYNQQFIQVESYDSNLIVEYDVLKQNQQWFIADSRVSNTY